MSSKVKSVLRDQKISLNSILILIFSLVPINQSQAVEAQGFWTSDKFYDTNRKEIVDFAQYNKLLKNGTVIGDGSLGAGDNAISFGAGTFWENFNFENNNQQYYLEDIGVSKGVGAYEGNYWLRGHYKIIEYDPETNTVYRQGYDIDKIICYKGANGHKDTCTNEQLDLYKQTQNGSLTDEQKLELFNGNISQRGSIKDAYNIKYTAIATRKLTNISSGDITPTSTDAVTGSQLYALQEKINNGNDYLSINASDAESSPDTSAKAQGAHSVALGETATSAGTNSTAIGHNATAGAANSIALGSDSQTFTTDVLASDTNGIVSVGSSAEDTSFTRRIVNVSDGVNDTDAATFGQLRKETRIPKNSDDNTYAYISVDKSAAENIVVLDGQVKANASSLDAKLDTSLSALTAEGETKITSLSQNSTNIIGTGNNVAIDSATENGVRTYTISVADNGRISLDETKLVTGKTVASETRVLSDGTYVKANTSAGSNISLLDKQIASNAASISDNSSLIQQNTQALNSKLDIDLADLSDTGKTAIGNLAQDAIEVNGSGNISVSSHTDDGTKRFSISVADNGTVSSTDTLDFSSEKK